MTLEKLLNKLIELGRKPRGYDFCHFRYFPVNDVGYKHTSIFISTDKKNSLIGQFNKSYNDLCSLDSGLRQFIVENELYIKEFRNSYIERKNISPLNEEIFTRGFNCMSEKFWVCQSSIVKDKEQFLLDNIALGQHQ